MKFQVFKNGKLAEDFNVSAAYMFGADTIPLRESIKIKCKNGIIDCRKKGLDNAGLVILWPVEGFGKVLLPTTRLPERKEPYNLNLELARARLMQITLKREDWSMFEEASSFADLAHEAESLFIESLKNIADPQKASVLADESLEKAIVFSEKLAAKHADLLFDIKYRNKGLGRHSLGCGVDAKMLDDEKYRKRLFEMFGFVTIPVSWAQIEPEQGKYDFSSLDACIDKLAGKRLAICAGPLLCFSEDKLPKWLLEKKLEFEKVREIAYDFVSRMVTRYCRYVHVWRLISGMNACNKLEFNFEQIIEMTRTACLAAKNADAKSKKIVEVQFPFGEYYAYDRDTVPPLVYTDMIMQSGISFDAFALQLKFGKNRPGMHIRDMLQISSVLDWFSPIGKPIHITEVAVPDNCGQDDFACDIAGCWHNQWDQQMQSDWIEQLYKVVLGKPFISTITYSSLSDSDSAEVPGSGLLTKDLKTKKALLAIAKLQKLIITRQKTQ
jgi:GH35 family endo-1,4-beta-xylanase